MVGGDGFVVVGEVVPGGGVVEAACVFGEAVHGFRRHVGRGLEHQVLEEVGKAGAAGRIILRADIVPDLNGNGGGGGIRHRIDPQAILKGALGVFEGGDFKAAVGLGLFGWLAGGEREGGDGCGER